MGDTIYDLYFKAEHHHHHHHHLPNHQSLPDDPNQLRIEIPRSGTVQDQNGNNDIHVLSSTKTEENTPEEETFRQLNGISVYLPCAKLNAHSNVVCVDISPEVTKLPRKYLGVMIHDDPDVSSVVAIQ